MAFTQLEDIQSQLPSGFDTALATRLLSNTEEDLKEYYNMEFVADSAMDVNLDAHQYNYKTIFRYLYIKTVTSVTIKSHDSDSYSETLTINEDYKLIEIPSLAGVYYAIELVGSYKQGLAHPYYLNVVGTKGFSEDVPTRLENAIIDYMYKQLSLFDLDTTRTNRVITGAKTGESDIRYSNDGTNNVIDSAIEDTEFVRVLKRYTAPPQVI